MNCQNKEKVSGKFCGTCKASWRIKITKTSILALESYAVINHFTLYLNM